MQLSVGSVVGKRQVQGLVMGLVILALIWELASWIVAGSDRTLIMFGLSLVICALVVQILNEWRSGVLLFMLWLLFEDLARKYLGNSTALFFGKDVLIGIAYLSFYFAKRRRQVEIFKIPFIYPLAIFFALALIQVFNTWSPSILYGILGIKLYFYYAPLMLLGYAMINRPEDLERFMVVNLAAGILIAGLGIAQSVMGGNFLSPDDIAPELFELTHTVRYSPITHSASAVTSSVFVSSGRFSFYLILLWILAMGAQGYLLLSRRPGAKYGFVGIGVVTVAIMVTGTRTPFVFMLASAMMMTAAFLWGAPWRWGQGHRLVKALRRSFFIGAVCLILMGFVFPIVLGDHWRFLSETLSLPGTEGSELRNRGWEYPMDNLVKAFQHERWVEGYGTGVTSLGTQYISRLLSEPVPGVGVENGYGNLVVEFGILGLVGWVFWVSALLLSGWKVVKKLRETVYFPLAFAIWWYAFVLLIMLVYFGLPAYQNYVNNAYLWLLIGVLYRLPKLATMPQPVPMPKHIRGMARWKLATGGR
jgi:hypothetical protein